MPGKTQRRKIYTAVIARMQAGQKGQVSPETAFGYPKQLAGQSLDTDNTNQALIVAIAIGLFRRLQRRDKDSACVVKEVISLCRRHFPKWESSLGTAAAQADVIGYLEHLTRRNLDLVSNGAPGPMQLLKENIELEMELEAIPLSTMLAQRKKWLVKQGFGSARAHYPDGELAEWVLHKRYGIGPSTIHKLLAQATRDLKSSPTV